MKHLSTTQEKEAVKLFNQGYKTYVEISKILKVPYQAVNTYMTKWKKKEGLLKKRKTRSDKKITETITNENIDINIPNIILQELRFLRNFYQTMHTMVDDLVQNPSH